MQVTGLGMKKAHGADSLLGFHCHKQLDVNMAHRSGKSVSTVDTQECC
jgi:hypothetical protein